MSLKILYVYYIMRRESPNVEFVSADKTKGWTTNWCNAQLYEFSEDAFSAAERTDGLVGSAKLHITTNSRRETL